MKKQILFSILFMFSFFGNTYLPVFSQEINTKAIIEKPSPETSNQIIIVKALIVKFPIDIEFDAGIKKEVPIVLLTIAPIYNNAGQIVIPENSRVDAKLVTVGEGKEKGTMIVAKSLIINGNSYPIIATVSTKVPAHKVKGKSRIEQAQEYTSTINQILSPSRGVTNSIEPSNITDNPESPKTNVNNTIKIVAGVLGGLSPRSKKISRISKGSEYILHLQKPLRFNCRWKDNIAKTGTIILPDKG